MNAYLVVTDAVLLVRCRKRDGGDHRAGFWVWFRPDMDSACAETIMTRFKGNPVWDMAVVGLGGRFVEVGECRGHCYGSSRREKGGSVEACWEGLGSYICRTPRFFVLKTQYLGGFVSEVTSVDK